jgi:hypothetical protein
MVSREQSRPRAREFDDAARQLAAQDDVERPVLPLLPAKRLFGEAGRDATLSASLLRQRFFATPGIPCKSLI